MRETLFISGLQIWKLRLRKVKQPTQHGPVVKGGAACLSLLLTIHGSCQAVAGQKGSASWWFSKPGSCVKPHLEKPLLLYLGAFS